MLISEGITVDTSTSEQRNKARVKSTEAYLAIAYLCGLNEDKYKGLLNDLYNVYMHGRDEYPKTLTAAYNLAISWKGDKNSNVGASNDGIAFTSDGVETVGQIHATDANGVQLTRSGKPVLCHVCSTNHYANECPDQEGQQPTQPTASANFTMGNSEPDDNDGWGDTTDFDGLMFCTCPHRKRILTHKSQATSLSSSRTTTRTTTTITSFNSLVGATLIHPGYCLITNQQWIFSQTNISYQTSTQQHPP